MNTKSLSLNIKNISKEEKETREESLKLFNKEGFPNKRLEEWKFTDLNRIITDNFKNLKPNNQIKEKFNINFLKEFEHNYIVLVNGVLKSKNFDYEDKDKIKITDYKEEKVEKLENHNPLIHLNNALAYGGYFLEISKKYKFKKPLVIYNFFLDNLENRIVNNKNLLVLNDEVDLDLLEVSSDISEKNFIYNNYTKIEVGENSSLKNYTLQGCNSNGFFYKYVNTFLKKRSNYDNYIFTSGLKFCRVEEDVSINGEEAKCSIQSALFLNSKSHQEIKSQLNHLKPNCISFQKIKNVLNKNCKGIYQGKIYVKDVAQKTDAYQLSKALLLHDSSEFNAKPELEIYADDVKCSHGSTSGSINEDSIFYLMTRGLPKVDAVNLLTKAFLYEISNSIKNKEIKKFVEKNLDRQIYEH